MKGKESHDKTVGRRHSSQVSEKEACALANAFWEEVHELAGARNIHSAGFLEVCSRLATTRHENNLSANLEKHGLSAAIPIQHVDVGLKIPHPILAVSDFIGTLNKRSKMDILLNGNRAEQFRAFWKRWKYLQPDHDIYRSNPSKLDWSIPVAIHCDEGTSQKKKALGGTISSDFGSG